MLARVSGRARPGDVPPVDLDEGGQHMLGDVIELSVVVKDMDEAIERYTRLFGLKVHKRGESKEFGFLNAILPTGIGHIELLQPTDPSKAVGKFLAKNGEGVYLVGFECVDVPGSVAHLKKEGARVTQREGTDLAWVHPRDANGLFVELRHREKYT
jgi:methylmalonyl-CoA/ethylmalonyl-CoA epimerase